jgi:hypothetical protein
VPRHEKRRHKDLNNHRHPNPAEKLNNADENRRFDDRRKDESGDGNRDWRAVGLPELNRARRKMK